LKTLLILLVGEMSAPFSAPLERALPNAFGQDVPEVRFGLKAPAGRSVAWVTLSNDGREVELLLHTARIPGDLRRVLRFEVSDGDQQRATTVAFALANMAQQREADLAAVLGAPLRDEQPGVGAPLPWAFIASALVALDLPGASWGGGLALRVERHLLTWLCVALGGEVSLFATPASRLLAPAAMVELLAHGPQQRLSPVVSIGIGASAWVVNHGAEQALAWVLLGRVAGGIRAHLIDGHAVQVLGAVSVSPTSVRLQVAERSAGTVGPVTARLEFAYVGAF
jgi:hypothetical protein